jgi:hypothetical protein
MTNETPQVPESRRPRISPIVWGVIVLAFCAYTAVQLFAPGTVDATTFAIISVIGLGLLLLAVGVAVIVRSTRDSQEADRSPSS